MSASHHCDSPETRRIGWSTAEGWDPGQHVGECALGKHGPEEHRHEQHRHRHGGGLDVLLPRGECPSDRVERRDHREPDDEEDDEPGQPGGEARQQLAPFGEARAHHGDGRVEQQLRDRERHGGDELAEEQMAKGMDVAMISTILDCFSSVTLMARYMPKITADM